MVECLIHPERDCPCERAWQRERSRTVVAGRYARVESEHAARGAIIPSIDDLHRSAEPEQGDQVGGLCT